MRSKTSPAIFRQPIRCAAILVVFTLLGAACTSSADDEATNGVASLEIEATGDAAAAQTEEETPDLSSDEAALEFSSCMRDNGVSFPDLAVGADGNIQIRESMQAADPGRGTPEFDSAIEACGAILEATEFGGGRGALQDNVEVADALVAVSDCVRDAGYDVGDLDFGQPGQNRGTPLADAEGQPDGERNAEGGNRQGGFGDIGSRLAGQLGLDPEDPDVIATMEICSPILTDALADAGLGR